MAFQTWPVALRKKVRGARRVEHASGDSDQAYVDGLREGCGAGATMVRVAQPHDPKRAGRGG